MLRQEAALRQGSNRISLIGAVHNDGDGVMMMMMIMMYNDDDVQ
jgi:hypothetical protein